VRGTIAVVMLVLCSVSGLRSAAADEAATYYHKAMAYKQSGKTEDAMRELKRALELREDYAAAHFSLGILYRQKKQTAEAIHHLERAVQLDSKSAQSHFSLGLAYNQAGRNDESMKELTEAAKLAPKDDQIQNSLGTLLIRKDAKLAIPYLQAAVNAKPTDPGYLHSLGLAYRKVNNNKLAEQYLLKSAALREEATTSFDLGVLYRRMNQPDKAAHYYESAIRLDPKLSAAHWDLAHMYQQLKRDDEAVESFEAYLKLQGDGKDAGIARKRLQELRAAKKGKKR